jgi:hypothetical protein
MIDESTKRFVSWAGTTYGRLLDVFHKTQADLLEFEADYLLGPLIGDLQLTGTRDEQYSSILKSTCEWGKLYPLKLLRYRLARFAAKVHKEETPYAKIAALIETARRRAGATGVDALPVAQSSFQVMATSLLLRCDVTLLADVLETTRNVRSGPLPASITVDLSINRLDCLALIAEAHATKDREREVEGHIFYIQYCTIEKQYASSPAVAEEAKAEGERHVDLAHALCQKYGGKLESLVPEIKDAERALHDGYFVQTVTTEERRSILAAMAQEFGRGTGNWYVCRNNHPFSVGECTRPMQLSFCPQCGEPIGGQHHTPAAGVSRADDLEAELRAMRLDH